MDPLSIIASITGILVVSAKITKAVTTFIGKEMNAPASMSHVITELSDLAICLAQLKSFVQGKKNIPNGQADVVTVEQVVVISTSLVTNISELDKWLDSFPLNKPMSVSNRLRWVRREGKILEILGRVRVSKESLNLIVTIFSCTSLEETKTSMCGIATAIDQILKHSVDVSHRLADVEQRIHGSSRYESSTIPTVMDRDKPLPGIEGTDRTPKADERPLTMNSFSQFDSSTESALFGSRIYSRTRRRLSTMSLPSDTRSGPGLSFLSGMSLSQVSNISLISLPVYCHELWNPHYYKTLQHSRKSSISRRPKYGAWGVSDTQDLVYNNRTAFQTLNPSLEVQYPGSSATNEGPSIAKSKSRLLRMPTGRASVQEVDERWDECWAKYEEYWSECWNSHEDQSCKPLSRQSKPVRMLFLGTNASGKSTAAKQISRIVSGSFSIQERKVARQIIYENLRAYFMAVCDIIMDDTLHNRPNFPKVNLWANALMTILQEHVDISLDDPLPRFCYPLMKLICADEIFAATLNFAESLAVQPFKSFHFGHYCEDIDRLFQPDYLPSDRDVLHAPNHNHELQESFFNIGGLNYSILDVTVIETVQAGCFYFSEEGFDIAHLVCFLVPLSGYDECLLHGRGTGNQMQQSLWLFEQEVNKPRLRDATIVLLFTKTDLFESKIQSSPIGLNFPDYREHDDDIESAELFFKLKFLSLDAVSSRRIHVFFTDLTDVETSAPILTEVMDLAGEAYRRSL